MRLLGLAAALAAITAFAASASTRDAEVHTVAAAPSSKDASHPSFDCSRATSAREKTICEDPALSALDGELVGLYSRKTSLLSPAGAKLLQTSERSWLHYIESVCASDGPDGEP